ncbi:MAG: HAD-IA family hydrolase [Nanoarchaeota archaeon]|nr:HAD-IA family hydrolase [Nanoarchaeota archaeon]
MPKKSDIIDERDKKILRELEENARQTDSSIAKKVRLSKQVTNYRIQQMIKQKIISNFYAVVNIGNLGLTTYYVFLQLEKISKEKEEDILKKINSINEVGWLISCIGKWDIILNVNESSSLNFEKTLNKIIKICEPNLYDYKFTILSEAEHIGYKFLGSRNYKPLYQGERDKSLKLDVTDEKILRVLSQNARIDTVSLSKKCKMPLHILSYRMKKLIKSGIIEGFKPKLNINKLGYQWHLLLIKLDFMNEEERKRLMDFCRYHKNTYYITSTIGDYNLMLDLHIKSAEEIIGIKKELQEKFPKLIKAYESVMVAEEFKIDYIPRGITTTALIFDLDGTLVNTEKFDGKILKKILDSYGLSSHKRFKGYSLEDYISKTTSDKQLQKKIKKEFISKYELILKNIQIEINSELLRYLKLGLSPLIALVTANNKQLTRRILNKTGLSKYFEIIVTCEDVKRQKPFPDPYLKALKELNVSPENCIVFEDSEVGVNSAKNAGIKNIRKVSY